MLNVRLKVVGGDAKTTEVKIKLPTIIGRSKKATLTLPHPLVSRNHCELFERDGGLWVRDLASLNGTFIDNVRLEGEQPLEPKQLLTIGNVTFRAVYGAEVDAGNVLDDSREEGSFAKPGDSSKSLSDQEIEFEEVADSGINTKPTEPGRPKPSSAPIDETVFTPSSQIPVNREVNGTPTPPPTVDEIASSNRAASASIVSALADIEEIRADDSVSLSALEGLEIDDQQVKSAEISSVSFHAGESTSPKVGDSFLHSVEEVREIEVKPEIDESSLKSFIRKLPR